MGEDEIKLSELTNTNLANDEDILMIVQNGSNKKITIGNLLRIEREKNVKLEEEIEKLKLPKRKILWKNTNTSTGMEADTIINLSSSDYDELEWFFIYSTATENLKNQQSFNCQKGCKITLFSIGYSTGASVRRTIDYVSDTQYKTRAAIRDTEESNTYCIPVAVVGIKY